MPSLLLLISLGSVWSAPASTAAPAPQQQPQADTNADVDASATVASPLDRNPFDLGASATTDVEATRAPVEDDVGASEPLPEPRSTTPPANEPPRSGGLPSDVSAAPAPTPAPAVTKKVWPQRAVRYRIDAAIGGANLWVGDWAYAAFDYESRRLMPQLTVRGDMPIADGKLFLGAAVSYRQSASSGDLVNESSDLRLREPMAGVRASYRLFDGLDVYGQVAAGPSIVDITLGDGYYDDYGDDDGPSNVVPSGTQRTIGLTADGLAGFTVYLPKKWMPRKGSSRISFGLDFAGGYQFRNAVTVQPNLDTAPEDIGIAESSLGDVAVRGGVFTFGLFGRFQ